MDRRIESVIAKIESDPSLCQLDLLAAMVNLSPSRLRHLFKQEVGVTPGKYLKQERLNKAELLLRTTFLSIKEIINVLGLPSNTHFVRDFRRIHKMTPTAYRKLNGLTSNRSGGKSSPA
jgi:AraC-like DNA-binding protein